MKHSNFLLCATCRFAAFLFFCTTSASAQLLQGHVDLDSIPDMLVTYSETGDVLNTVNVDVQTNANHDFVIDFPLRNNTQDATLIVENDVFGVHLEKGKTARIVLYKNKNGAFEIEFKGDNVDVNKVYNAYVRAFDIMKYFSPDPSEAKTNAQYRQILEQEHSALQKVLPTIKDKKLRNYYTQLTSGMYQWTKLRLIMDKSYEENKAFQDYPEYNEIVAEINPNDEMSIPTNLAMAWLISRHRSDYKGDKVQMYIENMKVVDEQITNPKVRKLLAQSIANNYFSFDIGEGEGREKFWEHYKTFAKDYEDLLNTYGERLASFSAVKKNSDVPYAPQLTKPDGTTLNLSHLYGKILYIDVWATWCAPCCKEIPHLEKLVEQFKNNDKVRFVSISIDQNKEAWLNKLATDKPAWEQYLLSGEEQNTFLKKWNIGGIPRFIILNKEGKIVDADAKRPSMPELATQLEELSKQ